MANASQQQEPSMEEILASIRRIISDEETETPSDGEAPAETPEVAAEPEGGVELNQDDLDKLFDSDDFGGAAEDEPEPEEEVMDLTEDFRVDEIPQVELTEASDISFSSEDEDIVPVEPMAVHSIASSATDALLSSGPDASVSAAFHNLTNTVLSNNARTLEDLVKEMLRPMLRAWLDDNLPPLVERLVRQEIERVSRNGP